MSNPFVKRRGVWFSYEEKNVWLTHPSGWAVNWLRPQWFPRNFNYKIQRLLSNEGFHVKMDEEYFDYLKRGVCKMNKLQKRTVYISITALIFFLVLSLMTHKWRFFLWSLLPVFMVLMTALSTNVNKKSNEKWKDLFNHRTDFCNKD